MIVEEDFCVDCGLPCLGSSCPNKKVKIRCCDRCNSADAVYEFDGEDLCSNCAEEVIKEIFDDMTLSEKAEACGIDMIDWS